MIAIGKINQLSIVRLHALGAFLDGGKFGEILLPAIMLNDANKVGDELQVFIYLNSDGELLATTETPLAQVGEVVFLKVAALEKVGAFLDWGLPKDLLLPFGEQLHRLDVGKVYPVIVFRDEQNRIAASQKINEFIEDEGGDFKKGQQVSVLVMEKTELGWKAIIENSHWGLFYGSELFQPLRCGQRVDAYIKAPRDDKRLDLSLYPPGYARVDAVTQSVLDKIIDNDGFMLITDKSPPEAIYSVFGVSKKVFKKAIGALYKQRKINIEKNGIRLLE